MSARPQLPGSSHVQVGRVHSMPFGAELHQGQGRFRLWAPAQASMTLVLEGRAPIPMQPAGDGWYECCVEGRAGARYRFALTDGTLVPDPASRFQPQDVAGPSELIDAREYRWLTGGWRGRPWEDAVIYELHLGAFTSDGTFRAAIDKLDHLASLGITAIELMPVADFSGNRNWGYDGVLPFAPDSSYGRPEDFKAFVDAAHARGLMVLLDVVYNHFGPVGNYLRAYAPQFFTQRHSTPWGDAINFDGPDSGPVREFMIHNALYWIDEYRLDGLRLDAVHAIVDDSPKHILAELAERVQKLAAEQRRAVHLILENEANSARFLERTDAGHPRLFTAQWNDDVHHCLHVAATGETSGYYEDYPDPRAMLARGLTEGFVYQGEPSVHQHGRPRGEPSRHLPAAAFVNFIQNHDQVGNRAFGERLTQLTTPQAVRAVAAVYLLSPATPMLFMGEEWGSSRPFTYFCDLPELAAAIREGRRKEFAGFPEFSSATARERIPDPNDPITFERARLAWSELEAATHSECLEWYRMLLTLRREMLQPLFRTRSTKAGFAFEGATGLRVCWEFEQRVQLSLLANLGAQASIRASRPEGQIILAEGAKVEDSTRTIELGPWAVVWCLGPLS
ncbi:MAG TPA: malto-oligosyltrehalose trehalohydrolase [Steroidobacteraceae bacterium]|nr:malto-oligosyltrehalose trehalohydrolase [Steroidobacteraceae bacterium]